jgi:nucleoside-diphosphate-sugar epimerase
MHVLVAGAGWLGAALCEALVARGDRVTAVRRDPARAAELARLGVAPLALDLAAPGAAARLPSDVEAVIACQAAGGEGEGPYRRAYLDANRALLEAAARCGARAFVYTGSTGVFGQRDGRDVDELTPPAPASRPAEVLVEAEALVRSLGAPARLVRLSGLYGPGRAGIIERVRSGALALGPGDRAWMNFCHREDAVRAVLAALDRGAPRAVYHASDAGPAPRAEVVRWIAARLGVAPATRAEAGGRSPAADRRILAERTRASLGLTLAFPTFRDGLAPLLLAPAPAP